MKKKELGSGSLHVSAIGKEHGCGNTFHEK